MNQYTILARAVVCVFLCGCAGKAFYRYSPQAPLTPIDAVWCEDDGISAISGIAAQGRRYGAPPPIWPRPPGDYAPISWSLYSWHIGCAPGLETRWIDAVFVEMCEEFREVVPGAVRTTDTVRIGRSLYRVTWDLSTEECRVLSVRTASDEKSPTWKF